jgi:6-phosphogluconolactonase
MTPRGIGLWAAALSVLVLVLPVASASGWTGGGHAGSAVFTMTNSPTGNEIVAYSASPSGTLSWVGNFSTGGTGTGASLADSGSLAVTSDHRWLLAVDAGSNQVSVFAIGQHGGMPWLRLTDVAGSGGVLPVSVTTFGSVVYVLNDGNASVAGNIAGFHLSPFGTLVQIRGSSEPLSTSGATGAAQIAFDPLGGVLVVTEKATNLLDVYAVGPDGRAAPPTVHPSQGGTPYGFAVSPSGAIVVSEASTGSLSSYRAGPHGSWTVLSSAVPDFQVAPCWVAITDRGTFAYTTNADSDSISSYALGHGGQLTLQSEVAATTDAAPTDLAFSPGSSVLYVHDAGAQEIETFAVSSSGALTWVSTVGGLSASGEGLVAV